MILPGPALKLEGVIGMTWDQVFTFYPPKYSHIVWNKKATDWNAVTTYKENTGVLASDENAYRAKRESTNKNPISSAEDWEKLTPLDNTEFKAEFKCGTIVLKNGEGITLGGATGKVSVKAKHSLTEKLTEASLHFSLTMENTEEDLYEYADGAIKWKAR